MSFCWIYEFLHSKFKIVLNKNIHYPYNAHVFFRNSSCTFCLWTRIILRKLTQTPKGVEYQKWTVNYPHFKLNIFTCWSELSVCKNDIGLKSSSSSEDDWKWWPTLMEKINKYITTGELWQPLATRWFVLKTILEWQEKQWIGQLHWWVKRKQNLGLL